MECTKNICSPYHVILNVKDKRIVIEYTEHILHWPGIVENFKALGEDLASRIEDGFKNQV